MANNINLFDYYREKTSRDGLNRGERLKSRQEQLLDKLLDDAPNSYNVRIGDNYIRAIIQDVYFNDELIKEKHLITEYGTDINVGDYVYWDEEPYIVLHKEDESVRSKQGVKIMACDNVLTWKDGDHILEVPTVTEDKTSPFSDGLNKAGGKFVRASDQISAIVQDNEKTNSIQLNQRFIFDHNQLKIFRLTRIKAMPSLGVLELVLKRDGYSPYVDNLDLNLADYYEPDYNIIKPYIDGVDEISMWEDFEVYSLRNYESDSPLTWKVSGGNIKLTVIDSIHAEVCVQNKNVFDAYTLSVYDGDELIASKVIHTVYM